MPPPRALDITIMQSMSESTRKRHPASSPKPGTDETSALLMLIVEDDTRLRGEVSAALQAARYTTLLAGDLAQARLRLIEGPDLVLLDLMLPDGSGLDLCRELRAAGSEVPIIAVTARDAVEQRVEGLDAGVDDYLVKPFSVAELLARMRSVLRRSQSRVVNTHVAVGELWADRDTRVAGKGEQELDLTPQEFDLLLFLLANPGKSWSRKQLLRHAWGLSTTNGDTRTVDTHVRRLRMKIEDDPSRPKHLATVWGTGYRLCEPE